MGIGSRLKGIFRRREEPIMEPVAELSRPEITPESASAENMKAKMDLVLTQLDSLSVKYNTLSEKIDRIERTLNEVYAIAKRSG